MTVVLRFFIEDLLDLLNKVLGKETQQNVKKKILKTLFDDNTT